MHGSHVRTILHAWRQDVELYSTLPHVQRVRETRQLGST